MIPSQAQLRQPKRKKYIAEPTPTLFHRSDAPVRGIMGPVGSGKTTACIMEMVRRGQEAPICYDGVRRSRWAVIRNTFPELKNTTIKTYQDWLPEHISPIKGGSPISTSLRIPLPDGSVSEQEILFMAFDKPKDIGKLKSLELTGAYLNEASELPFELLETLRTRLGRYPAANMFDSEKQDPWFGVIMDTNPPPENHWWFNTFETERPPGFAVFKQPGGIVFDAFAGKYVPNPLAENITNLNEGYDYYMDKVAGSSDGFIRTMLMGQYGQVHFGKVVYPSYSDSVHVAPTVLSPQRQGKLILGFDWGLNPACVIAQLSVGGTLIILDEIAPEDCSLEEFLDKQVLPLVRAKYPAQKIIGVGDPSGRQREAISKRTPFGELRKRGIAAFPVGNNQFVPRKEAVEYFLARKDGFVMNPGCTTLRQGFLGGYRFRQVQSKGFGQYSERPEKNQYSHIHDALQYVCQYALQGVTRQQKKLSRRTRNTPDDEFFYA